MWADNITNYVNKWNSTFKTLFCPISEPHSREIYEQEETMKGLNIDYTPVATRPNNRVPVRQFAEFEWRFMTVNYLVWLKSCFSLVKKNVYNYMYNIYILWRLWGGLKYSGDFLESGIERGILKKILTSYIPWINNVAAKNSGVITQAKENIST